MMAPKLTPAETMCTVNSCLWTNTRWIILFLYQSTLVYGVGDSRVAWNKRIVKEHSKLFCELSGESDELFTSCFQVPINNIALLYHSTLLI